MKITDKIISIPPYISTTWDKVALLRMNNQELVITLQGGSVVVIPNLPTEVIHQLFNAHLAALESQAQQVIAKPSPQKQPGGIEQIFGSGMKVVLGGLDSLNQVLQHNPDHKDLAPLPAELAQKIAMVAHAIPQEDIAAMPNPEANCNCMHCQIMRILKHTIGKPVQEIQAAPDDEEVSDAELHFEEWDVKSLGNNLYTVTNKLDTAEQYNVFLGEPVGCTCGKPHCEHIIAVLRH